MIYSPAHYQEKNDDLVNQVMRDYSFATLITQTSEGPFVSHLPLLLEISESGKTLIGHCAKANPQWRHFAEGKKLTVIFHGPHAYISPAWYAPQADNVPTWNYVAVHVEGTASIISDALDVYEVLQKLVYRFENDYGTGWKLPEKPNDELSELFRHIVAFRINVRDIKAKFKLSQKVDPQDRKTVVGHLSQMGDLQREVANFMAVKSVTKQM